MSGTVLQFRADPPPRRRLELAPVLASETDSERPKTRGDCAGVPRPCPFVTCSQHLFASVHPRTGALTINFPGLEPDEMPAAGSCALDLADQGPMVADDIAAALGTTPASVKRSNALAMKKARWFFQLGSDS